MSENSALECSQEFVASITKSSHNTLTKYNANPYIYKWIKETTDTYKEDIVIGKNKLGYTEKFPGGTVMLISPDITDVNRKLFTRAHEFGHVILHPEVISGHPLIESDETLRSTDYKIERDANAFAANLLLPDSVLRAHIIEGNSTTYIRHIANVSYETIKYRVIDLLINRYRLSKVSAKSLAKTYTNEHHIVDVRACSLYYFLHKAKGINYVPTKALSESDIMSAIHNRFLADSLAPVPA